LHEQQLSLFSKNKLLPAPQFTFKLVNYFLSVLNKRLINNYPVITPPPESPASATGCETSLLFS
jgi:hypothetical protein